MWNISKTADRRAKRTKIWDSVHVCRVLLMAESLSLAWGHSVHFAKFPMLRFQKATAPTVFIQFQPNFIVSMLVMKEFRL